MIAEWWHKKLCKWFGCKVPTVHADRMWHDIFLTYQCPRCTKMWYVFPDD